MSTSDESEQPDSAGGDTDDPAAEETTGAVSLEEAKKAVTDDGKNDQEYTPQPQELRQQQYAVGVGAAIIAGFALAISSMQHFPQVHEAVPLIAGFVGAGLVYWIVQHSLFPTNEELSAGE